MLYNFIRYQMLVVDAPSENVIDIALSFPPNELYGADDDVTGNPYIDLEWVFDNETDRCRVEFSIQWRLYEGLVEYHNHSTRFSNSNSKWTRRTLATFQRNPQWRFFERKMYTYRQYVPWALRHLHPDLQP